MRGCGLLRELVADELRGGQEFQSPAAFRELVLRCPMVLETWVRKVLPSLKLTAKAPENRPSQKGTIVFQPSIFRGEMFVSGRVVTKFEIACPTKNVCKVLQTWVCCVPIGCIVLSFTLPETNIAPQK